MYFRGPAGSPMVEERVADLATARAGETKFPAERQNILAFMRRAFIVTPLLRMRTTRRRRIIIDLSRHTPGCTTIPVSAVTLGDGFWNHAPEGERGTQHPHPAQLMEEHGVVDNFRHRLSGRKQAPPGSAVHRFGF